MYDIVIIGSGLGGLECGYILAKAGFKVAIVEKNNQIGGCLQTFQRFGVKFDTGVHYIGSLNPGQFLHQAFLFFDLFKDIELSALNSNGYDTFCIGDKIYKYASGYEQFIDVLSSSFPKHYQEIKRYVQQIQSISNHSPIADLRRISDPSFFDSPAAVTSVNDFITSFTNNPTLQNVLAANLPLYGGEKGKSQAYIHAIINNSYMQGAYRIAQGGDRIALSLAHSIRQFGGEIFVGSPAVEIVCNSEKATAVRLANDNRLEAKFFISNAHPATTLRLLNTPLIRKIYRERICGLQNTTAHFAVYLKFKKNSVPYLNTNFYFYENEDVWNAYSYDINSYPSNYLYMHHCHEPHPQYAESGVIMSSMCYQDIKKWENSIVGKRRTEYSEFKKNVAQRMIAQLERSFPEISRQIEAYETSSPLTYRDYTGTSEGSSYGIIHDKNAPLASSVSHKTKIPNLFFTGQNIYAHGILGVTIGSLITCTEFVGIDKLNFQG